MDEPKHPAPVDLAVERERTSARLTVFEHGLYVRAEIALEMGSPDEWLFDAMAHISARQCLPGSREAGFAVVSSEALFIVGGKIEELLVGGKPWPWPEEDDG